MPFKVNIVKKDLIRTKRNLARAAKHLSAKSLAKVNKIGAEAVQDNLKDNIKDRWTGKLKESVEISKSGQGGYAVVIHDPKQNKIFGWYDQGRRAVRAQAGKMLFIPLTPKGHEGYNPDFNPKEDTSKIKYGVDFILKAQVKPFKGHKIKNKAINHGKRVWKRRVNQYASKRIFTRYV